MDSHFVLEGMETKKTSTLDSIVYVREMVFLLFLFPYVTTRDPEVPCGLQGYGRTLDRHRCKVIGQLDIKYFLTHLISCEYEYE